MSIIVESRSISLEAAQHVVEVAVASAARQGINACVAVSDQAGHLISYVRMDRALLLCGQLAEDKAYTAVAFGIPTHEWWDTVRDEPALLHGVIKTDRLIIFGGGMPIVDAGELIGAVGVSGGSPEQDRAIAESAARSFARLPASPEE
jgi:glc operon protein GlcG